MRRLMLLRHAKTENDAPSGQDQDRRLDDRGRLDAAAIGRLDRPPSALPDTVLVSTAVRAQQTWEIAREAMQDVMQTIGAARPQVELLGRTLRRRPGAAAADHPHGGSHRSRTIDAGRP